MEQPKVYNTEEELIKWLKYDLKEQRRETAELEEAILGEKIPLKKVEESYLTLNIGMKAEDISDDYTEYIEINFEFNLNDIIYKLFNKFNDDINCIINCNILIFKKEAYFSDISFNNIIKFMNSKFIDNVNFSNTTFNNEINLYGVLFNKDIDLLMTKFNNEANFSWAIFNNEVDFSNVSFDNKVDFSFVNFKNEIYFYGTSFNNASFTRTNFFKNIYFHGISISEKIEVLIDMKYDTEIKFDNVIFENTNSNLFIVNISNSILNKISINNSNIDGKIILRNIKAENIDLKKCKYSW